MGTTTADDGREGRPAIPQILGYQVANARGENVQGEDPSGFASFEIMEKDLADHFAATHPGFLLMPIYEGDIEGPSLVGLGAADPDWETTAPVRFAARRLTDG